MLFITYLLFRSSIWWIQEMVNEVTEQFFQEWCRKISGSALNQFDMIFKKPFEKSSSNVFRKISLHHSLTWICWSEQITKEGKKWSNRFLFDSIVGWNHEVYYSPCWLFMSHAASSNVKNLSYTLSQIFNFMHSQKNHTIR